MDCDFTSFPTANVSFPLHSLEFATRLPILFPSLCSLLACCLVFYSLP